MLCLWQAASMLAVFAGCSTSSMKMRLHCECGNGVPSTLRQLL
jgi:hypothetical protein